MRQPKARSLVSVSTELVHLEAALNPPGIFRLGKSTVHSPRNDSPHIFNKRLCLILQPCKNG